MMRTRMDVGLETRVESRDARVGMRSANEGTTFFSAYAADPYSWWPARSDRQARKLDERVAQLTGRRNVSAAILVEELLATATIRQRTRRPTIYLSNIGSSGSHWFESLLVAGGGMLGAGEVYLSKTLKERLSTMPLRAQAIFVDALHLLHARAVPARSLAANTINSCHSSGIRHFSRSEPDCIRVLLLRDPLEVCLSRTFRKAEYRKAVAPTQDDRAYLELNLRHVLSFLKWAQSERFDLTVRYEDLREEPRPMVHAICKAAGASVDIGKLDQAIERHDAGRISQAGGIAGSNLFMGERTAVQEELQTLATEQLTKVRRALGYI